MFSSKRVTPIAPLSKKADVCDQNQDEHKGLQKVGYSTLTFLDDLI